MVDYSVDDTFDLHFTKWGDFVEVEGREEFEEDLVIQIDDNFGELLDGIKDTSTLTEKVELLATRVARDFDVLDRIKRIRVTEPNDKPETLSVVVVYYSGEIFEETL